MDSMNPYSHASGFMDLLTSQNENHSLDGEPLFSTQQESHDEHTPKERRERRKWSPTEDVILISAWLNTSNDAIVGNEQKGNAFWSRITTYFHASPRLVGVQKREVSHCKQRWHKINEQVCKFVGCYEAAMKQQTSGQNENDLVKVAHQFFFNDHKVKFTLEHAWRELRHDQKWCSAKSSTTCGGASKRRKLEAASAQSSSHQVSNGEDEAMTRPPGVKAAKAKGKKTTTAEEEANSANDLLVFQSMWDIKKKDMTMKLFDSLLAKTEPLSDIEMALKNKLITDMLSNA